MPELEWHFPGELRVACGDIHRRTYTISGSVGSHPIDARPPPLIAMFSFMRATRYLRSAC